MRPASAPPAGICEALTMDPRLSYNFEDRMVCPAGNPHGVGTIQRRVARAESAGCSAAGAMDSGSRYRLRRRAVEVASSGHRPQRDLSRAWATRIARGPMMSRRPITGRPAYGHSPAGNRPKLCTVLRRR